MDLPSAQLRRQLLPEAFVPASSRTEGSDHEASFGDSDSDALPQGIDAETEQLSTTPLQLLQVRVKAKLKKARVVRMFLHLEPTFPSGTKKAAHNRLGKQPSELSG